MKKIFTITVLAAAILFAGKSNAQLSIHAGYAPEAWANENNTTNVNSFFLGVDDNINISGDLNLSVGVGVRYGTESGTESLFGLAALKHTTTLIGIDVPVLFNYNLRLSSDLGLGIFVGPKLTYSLSGKTKYDGNALGLLSSDGEVDWFSDEGTLDLNRKPLNVSATFGLALNFRQFRLFGGYNYGLLDVDNSDNTKTSVSGPFFGLGINL